MVRRWILFASALGLTACQELPTDAEYVARSEAVALTGAASTVVSLVCSRTWTGVVNGLWFEPGNWSPAGPPDSTDVACFDTSAPYLSVGAFSTTIRGLQLGSVGGTGLLELKAYLSDSLMVLDTVLIRENAVLDMLGGHLEAGGVIINEGGIQVGLGYEGTIQGNLENYDHVSGLGGTLGWTADRVTMFDGTLLGDVIISADRVRWADGFGYGATISTREFIWQDGNPSLQVSADIVQLASTFGHTGLDLLYADSVFGDVDGGLDLEIGGGGLPSTYVFRKTRTGAQLPLTNEGSMTIAPSSVGSVTLDVGPGLVNRGRIDFERPATIVGGRLVNRDTIHVAEELTIETGIENHGTIEIEANRDLDMAPGSLFDARPGSEVRGGEVWLQGARLIGQGSLSNVQSAGGTIQPGAPYGTLSLGALELDALSHVEIEIADTVPGGFDQLAVSGTLNLYGDLRLTTAATLQGGRCGQTIPIITNTWQTDGAFQSISGLAQPGQAAWRVQEWQNTVYVTGYRPANRITLEGGALTVEEGGASATYRMCMGTAAPTSSVMVTPLARLGQVTVTSSVTFDVADWTLPRTVTVTAIDDPNLEGVHADTIGHAVSTTDPLYSGSAIARQPVTVIDNDASADLSLIQLLQEDNQFLGDTMNTTFRVTNSGPSASSGARVVSLPLAGLTLVSASGATCTVDGTGTLRCALGAIATGGQVDFTVQFRGAVVGLHSNTLTVQGLDPDPDPTNDTVVYTQRVN